MTIYRTKEQRISDVKPIIKKLSELDIKASEHEEIRELLHKIQIYIQQIPQQNQHQVVRHILVKMFGLNLRFRNILTL